MPLKSACDTTLAHAAGCMSQDSTLLQDLVADVFVLA
jgi:hypothetical protein